MKPPLHSLQTFPCTLLLPAHYMYGRTSATHPSRGLIVARHVVGVTASQGSSCSLLGGLVVPVGSEIIYFSLLSDLSFPFCCHRALSLKVVNSLTAWHVLRVLPLRGRVWGESVLLALPPSLVLSSLVVSEEKRREKISKSFWPGISSSFSGVFLWY